MQVCRKHLHRTKVHFSRKCPASGREGTNLSLYKGKHEEDLQEKGRKSSQKTTELSIKNKKEKHGSLHFFPMKQTWMENGKSWFCSEATFLATKLAWRINVKHVSVDLLKVLVLL
uniref:Uncharacterized protein n=1 Tax=Anguilla anguilla TaxID=7936 RepID=A0A0E9X059_ANGAN